MADLKYNFSHRRKAQGPVSHASLLPYPEPGPRSPASPTRGQCGSVCGARTTSPVPPPPLLRSLHWAPVRRRNAIWRPAPHQGLLTVPRDHPAHKAFLVGYVLELIKVAASFFLVVRGIAHGGGSEASSLGMLCAQEGPGKR